MAVLLVYLCTTARHAPIIHHLPSFDDIILGRYHSNASNHSLRIHECGRWGLHTTISAVIIIRLAHQMFSFSHSFLFTQRSSCLLLRGLSPSDQRHIILPCIKAYCALINRPPLEPTPSQRSNLISFSS